MYHIIVNPIAGRGKSLKLMPVLADLFKKRGLPCEILHTAAPMDAYHYAKDICQKGSSGIIGIGGDGTLQEIVAGMESAFSGKEKIPVPLGIMPCGSGNDFILTLGGKKKKKESKSIESFFNGVINNHTKTVDLIKANGMAYLNIANMGLDARIVLNAVHLKTKFGRYAYLAAVYKSILQHKNLPLLIKVNGEVREGKYTLAAVCNGQYYGGGMRIAPEAQVDDGKITVCLVDAVKRPTIMVLFPSILFELHVHLKIVHFIQCEKIEISLANPDVLCLDGNLYERSGLLTFEIVPKTLSLFMDD